MINDGTAWDGSLPLATALQTRALFGHGYRNECLEAKRRAAIQWLREQSRTGWACDKVQKRNAA